MASADDAGKKPHYRPVAKKPGIYAYNLKNGQLRYYAIATFRGRQLTSSGHLKVEDAWADKSRLLSKLGGSGGTRKTLKEFLELDFLDAVDVSAGSLRSYKADVANIVKWLKDPRVNLDRLRLDEFDAAHVQRFKTWLRKLPLADNTKHRVFVRLSQAMEHAWRLRMVVENPCKRLTAPPKGTYEPPRVGAAELEALLRAAFATEHGLIVYMAMVSGLREEKEIFAAQWSDLDFGTGILEIVGKGNKKRSVVLDELDVQALQVHRLAQMKRFEELKAPMPRNIFVNADGSPWTQANFYDAWNAIRKAAAKEIVQHGGTDALARLHFHDLRHIHMTSGAKTGVAPAVMQKRAGHSDAALTLNIYTHADVEDQRPAAKAITEFIRGAYNPFENALSDRREVDS